MPFFVGYKDAGSSTEHGIPVRNVVVGRDGLATREMAEEAVKQAEAEVTGFFASLGQSPAALEFFIVEAEDTASAMAQISRLRAPPKGPDQDRAPT